jgi:transcriptional regulator with XRE-family HTH domain
MKRTPDDERFGEDFARQLLPHYQAAIASGVSEKVFASRLGVDRGGLQRYLKKHATPSLRTLVFANREFGIAVPYGGSDTQGLFSRRTVRRRPASDLQMILPLTIEARDGEIDIVIKKKAARRYRLQVKLTKPA